MAILEMPVRRRGQPGRQVGSSLRRIGGPREFSTFAFLVLCFAVALAFVVQRGRPGNGAGLRPVASTQPASAPNLRSAAPISVSDDTGAGLNAAASDIANSASDVVDSGEKIVWEPALWLSNQVLGYVADASVNPMTGDRLIFKADPGVFNMAVAVLAFVMLAVVALALAGPIYMSWKSWRLTRAHPFR
jgi:hypothetical protein